MTSRSSFSSGRPKVAITNSKSGQAGQTWPLQESAFLALPQKKYSFNTKVWFCSATLMVCLKTGKSQNETMMGRISCPYGHRKRRQRANRAAWFQSVTVSAPPFKAWVGRCGSLLLHRVTLSFTTPRWFYPAHDGAPACTVGERERNIVKLGGKPGAPGMI
jgi:hypothetical protein